MWKAIAGIFVLVYSAYMNVFSRNFPLHEFILVLRTPTQNFSNDPSLNEW